MCEYILINNVSIVDSTDARITFQKQQSTMVASLKKNQTFAATEAAATTTIWSIAQTFHSLIAITHDIEYFSIDSI